METQVTGSANASVLAAAAERRRTLAVACAGFIAFLG